MNKPQEQQLFNSLMPYGGQLETNNQLVMGILIGKTIRGLSDENILEYFYENPYF